jgi:glutamate/tyrosine decarboxylase-like PLP-dependent enzyme
MSVADQLADAIEASRRFELWNRPQAGITVFRPVDLRTAAFVRAVPVGMLSTCELDGETWARSVAANPSVDVDLVAKGILAAGRERA